MPNRFFDAHVRPPRGGWSFPFKGEVLTGYSESEIVDQIARVQRNNASFVSEAAISEELWAYYCRREPERCGLAPTPPAPDGRPAPIDFMPRNVTPEVQGPPIWLFLNTLAVQWMPGLHDYFLATCDAIIVMLECPVCREEWRKILADDPPAGLNAKYAVCQWVNRTHNRVNANKGKQDFPYWKMVTEFGAPIS